MTTTTTGQFSVQFYQMCYMKVETSWALNAKNSNWLVFHILKKGNNFWLES